MIFELLLIIVSFGTIVFLLTHKMLEGSRGVMASVRSVREKADPILEGVHETTGRFFSYVTVKNAGLFAKYIFVNLIKFFALISKNVHEFLSSVVEKASNKREDLSKGGAASFYLKQIKEVKENGKEAD